MKSPNQRRDTFRIPVSAQVIVKLREKQKPMVIDADGLYITTKSLDLVRGYDLAILTPNKNEFQRLANEMKIPLEGEGTPEDPLMEITRQLDGPIVIRKGKADSICDGKITIHNAEAGSKRRAGGQVIHRYANDVISMQGTERTSTVIHCVQPPYVQTLPASENLTLPFSSQIPRYVH